MAPNPAGLAARVRGRPWLLRGLIGGAILIAVLLAAAAIRTTLRPEDASLGFPDPNKATATVETQVHSANHATAVVTTKGGTMVPAVPRDQPAHAWVQVSGSGRGLRPSGSVTFNWFEKGDCSGDSLTSPSMALVSGIAHMTLYGVVRPAGTFSLRAVYSGDFNYNLRIGTCVVYVSG